MRSLLASEDNVLKGSPVNWMPRPTKEDIRRAFLYSITGAANLGVEYDCNKCGIGSVCGESEVALVVWCVECQSLSYLCLECSQRRPDEVPDLISLCNNSSMVSLTS